MKRWIFKLVVFLLLGAIVNVALAWTCALWTPLSAGTVLDEQQRTQLGLKSHYQLRSDVAFGYTEFIPGKYSTPVVIDSSLAEGGRWVTPTRIYFPDAVVPYALDTSPSLLTNPRLTYQLPWIEEVRAGWPFRSLMAQPRQMGLPFKESIERGVFPPKWVYLLNPKPGRRIPLHPIWPGFAINTIFYAAILWLVILGPFTARRIIRRKRGLCINCGYDLRGTEHEVCPECGVAGGPPAVASVSATAYSSGVSSASRCSPSK